MANSMWTSRCNDSLLFSHDTRNAYPQWPCLVNLAVNVCRAKTCMAHSLCTLCTQPMHVAAQLHLCKSPVSSKCLLLMLLVYYHNRTVLPLMLDFP